jgi:hypothetical protein
MVSCARTKTEAVVDNVLVPHCVATATQDLNETPCLAVSTDGRNHSSQKLFPVVQGRGVHVTGVSAAYTFKLNKNIPSE